jgi:hypothetical protein
MLNDAEDVAPCPSREIVDVAPVKLAVSWPRLSPRAVGVKVIGTVIDWPVERETGSEGGELPMVNADPAISNDVTVVGAVAVKVAVALVD